MRSSILFLVLAFLSLADFAGAQAIDHPTPVPTLTPDQVQAFKETHLIYDETDVFGVHFFLNGREIQDETEMEKLIASVEDEQAFRSWKAAEDRDTWGWVLVVGGSGMVAGGGILSWQANSSATLDNILTLGGLTLDLLGGLLWREAQMDRLSAVDRYNAIVKEDNGISLLDLKDRGAGLAWVQRF